MLKLEMMKGNVVKILQALLENQNLVKYLKYGERNPLEQPDSDLPAFDLLFTNAFPYPFDELTKTEAKVYLHAYHLKGRFKSRVVENNVLAFDIVVPKRKEYWLLYGGELRPEAMMYEIINSLNEKDLGLGGLIGDFEFFYRNYNESYNGITLYAEYVNFSTKGKK